MGRVSPRHVARLPVAAFPGPVQPDGPCRLSGQNPAPGMRREWPGGRGRQGLCAAQGSPGQDRSREQRGRAVLPRWREGSVFALTGPEQGGEGRTPVTPGGRGSRVVPVSEKALTAPEGGSRARACECRPRRVCRGTVWALAAGPQRVSSSPRRGPPRLWLLADAAGSPGAPKRPAVRSSELALPKPAALSGRTSGSPARTLLWMHRKRLCLLGVCLAWLPGRGQGRTCLEDPAALFAVVHLPRAAAAQPASPLTLHARRAASVRFPSAHFQECQARASTSEVRQQTSGFPAVCDTLACTRNVVSHRGRGDTVCGVPAGAGRWQRALLPSFPLKN